MFNNLSVDFNKVGWSLWISVMAAAFTLWAVRYNPDYVPYGFITFAYGIVCHVIFPVFDGLYGAFDANKLKDMPKKYWWSRLILHLILIAMWVGTIYLFAVNNPSKDKTFEYYNFKKDNGNVRFYRKFER